MLRRGPRRGGREAPKHPRQCWHPRPLRAMDHHLPHHWWLEYFYLFIIVFIYLQIQRKRPHRQLSTKHYQGQDLLPDLH